MTQRKNSLNKSGVSEQEIKTKRKSAVSMKSSHSHISSVVYNNVLNQLLNFDTEQSLSPGSMSKKSSKCTSQNINTLAHPFFKENKQTIRNQSFRKQKVVPSGWSKDLMENSKVIQNRQKRVTELQGLLKRAKSQLQNNLLKEEQSRQNQQLIEKLRVQLASSNAKLGLLQKQKQNLVRKNKQLFSENEQLTIKIITIKEELSAKGVYEEIMNLKQKQPIFFTGQDQSFAQQQKKKIQLKLANAEKQLNEYMFKYDETQSQVSNLQLKLYQIQKQLDYFKQKQNLEIDNKQQGCMTQFNDRHISPKENKLLLYTQKQIQTEQFIQSHTTEGVAILEQCIADKNIYIEILKKRSKEYEVAITLLTKSLYEAKQKNAQNQLKIQALSEQVNDNQNKVKEKQITISKLKQQICQTSKAIQHSSQQKLDSQNYVNLLEQKCKQLVSQNDRLITSYQSAKLQKQNLVLKQKQQNTRFYMRTREYDTKIQQLMMQISQKQEKMMEVSSKFTKMSEQLEQSKKLIQNRQKEIKQNQQVSQRVLNAIQQAMINKETIYIKQIQQKQTQRMKANESELKMKSELQNALKVMGDYKKQIQIKTACYQQLCQKLISNNNGTSAEKVSSFIEGQQQISLRQNKKQTQQEQIDKDLNRVIYEQKLQILKLKQVQETLLIKLQQITKLCHQKDNIIQQNQQTIRVLQDQGSYSNRAGAESQRKLKQYNIKLSQQYDEINDKYAQCFNQLQKYKATISNFQSCIKDLNQKIQYQTKQNNELKLKLQIQISNNKKYKQFQSHSNLVDNKDFEQNIKFLTQELKVWSNKYQTVAKENSRMKIELQNYKGMYKVMSQNPKSVSHSLSSSKLVFQNRKYSKQKSLERQMQKYKMKVIVLKQQNQRLESTMNIQLKKRKQMIEDLIREKNILYEQIGTSSHSS